ncbi:MAG: PAS domain-containing protein [Salinisphaera sp.]|nr:PAS domain-containing protein [Salinisphaera sp.]
MSANAGSAQEPAAAIPVVAIGASAGGLEQIKLLLKNMPTDTGAAFVVIQHLDPQHQSHLTELLAQAGELPAVTVEDGMPAQANHVHILPPGYRLGIDGNGVFYLTTSQGREARPTLIDSFLRDLAAARGRRAVGIVLSGSGSDGALGLKAIRSAGGLAMAQHPDHAEFDSMPRAAATHASPDCLLDTEELVAPLCNHLRLTLTYHEPSVQADTDDNGPIDDAALAAVLRVLRERDRYDFRHHKPAMLKRRLQRRMALGGVSSTRTYLGALQKDAEERNRLCSDFLISVTDFFREPDSYRELNDSVIRKLLKSRSVDSPIRVWVPGCATGEEAYSIAMLLAEAIKASGRGYQYIVFATDIDESALIAARSGIYPDSIEADLSSERLRSFFDRVDSHYQIKRSLRERVVFASQSVADDPPYSRLDLISCRNLLIYLTAETQQRVITLFHFALEETGFLFLGSSETVGKQVDLFEPLSKEHRLYRRLTTSRQYRVNFPSAHGIRAEASPAQGNHRNDSGRPRDAEQIAREILLAEHVPAAVLVNRKLEILCSYGPTQDYLALPLGESSLGLMEMVRDAYRSHLRAVTHRAFRDPEQSHSTTVQEANEQTLVITARPLRQPEQARGLVLVTFERLPAARSAQLEASSSDDLERQLAEELDATRNELHGTIAALEESNEDLKGSNEEVMSMNEELQSTNEELETSKEELQSVNEELTTVNTELEAKVAELESAHNDLNNLFSGTQVATLFLDRALCIKRFTPAIRKLLNLISADIGRPLRDMTLKFNDPHLLADADKVLAELTPREAEVASADGERWYQRRILPYRTRDDAIEGVVISFADITDLRSAMLSSREHEARLDLAVSALNGGMWDMPIASEVPDKLRDEFFISERLKRLLGFDNAQMPNSLQAWIERIVPEDQASYADIVGRQSDERPLHYRIRHHDGSIRWMASYGRVITDAQGQPSRWIGISCDITDTKLAAIRSEHLQAQIIQLADALPQMLAFIGADNHISFANTAFQQRLATGAEIPAGKNLAEVLETTIHTALAGHINTALQGKASSCELALPDSRHGVFKFVPYSADGKVTGYYLLVTEEPRDGESGIDWKSDQDRLVYIQRMAATGEMASMLAHDLNQPLAAINNYASAVMRMVHAGKPADDSAATLRKIAGQVERAGDIINNLRDFIGHRDTGQDRIDFGQIVQTALSLTAGRVHKMGVDVEVVECNPQPVMHGNTVQLQQVLVNLISNALDAMRDTDRTARRLHIAVAQPDTAQIQIVIEDSGPGVAIADLESIFDAFHSSKLEGMGMGLAICRAIVQGHGGQLWAESDHGHGARFVLSLPAAEDGGQA